jgi:hypothetical protein
LLYYLLAAGNDHKTMTEPSFLGLPLELRREVYRYLLVKKRALAISAFEFRARLNIDILRTCKQVLLEAQDVLLTENTLKLWLYEPYPSRTQLQMLCRAPRLTVIINRQCNTPIIPAFQILAGLLISHHGLRELDIEFDFTSRHPHPLTIQRAQTVLAPLFSIRVQDSVSLKAMTTGNKSPTFGLEVLPHFRRLLRDLERSMMGVGVVQHRSIEDYNFLNDSGTLERKTPEPRF